ncbi:lyase family protein [Leucobacter sp. NPDC058333]|uniref:lyase family protein n=1 Tax=Leucobacter sp. NPDC058333 TaxID=3346450 RepID=UPI003661779A
MPTEPGTGDAVDTAIDRGLLSPVTVGFDALTSDAEFAGCLVAAEVAVVRAWAAVGVAPQRVAERVSAALGWRGTGEPCDLSALDAFPLDQLINDSVAGGNPVIPLVGVLRERVPEDCRAWVHRGVTSQDIMDSVLMLLAARAGAAALTGLRATEDHLAAFAARHRDDVCAARTLTQQAVPTTVGLRASGWVRGVRRAGLRLEAALSELPAQLAGAAGTLASFAEIARLELGTRGSAEASAAAASASAATAAALALPTAHARELGLCPPEGPWHTVRWPVTELGDALAQTVDAVAVIAADVATLSRSEIGELAEGSGGGSSAMPQKRNPARSVLIRSAALRAPHLAATLHTAAALAVDERPDGAWHAEWPALRELLRLACGATGHAAELVAGLRTDPEAARVNLARSRGLIVAERLAIVLGPVIGADRVRQLVAAAGKGDLAALLRDEPLIAEAGIDIAALLDPANYTGLAGEIVDASIRTHPTDDTRQETS